MWATKVTVHNPFNPRDREVVRVDVPLAGLPIIEMCKDNESHSDMEWVFSANGATVDDTYVVSPGDVVVVCPILKKDSLNAILKLVVAIVTIVIFNVWGFSVLGLVLAAGANMLIDAVVPPPTPDTPILADAWSESPTYGWDQLRPTKGQGYIIPLLYGTHKVSGQVLSKHITVSGDNQFLHLMMSACHGEVDSITDIRINDQPTTYFRNIATYTRLGTNDDTVIPGFGIIPSLKSVNVKLTTLFHTVITDGNLVDEFSLEFSFPQGLYSMTDKGAIVSLSVDVNIEYRVVGETVWTVHPTQTFTAASTSAVRRSVSITGLASNQYEIQISRALAESTDIKIRDSVYWSAITEIINEPIQYNGLAKYAVSALATDQLSGSEPVLSALVSNLTVQVYNPSILGYESRAATNPAWAAYDLLHNELSGDIPAERIDYDMFLEFANYCDELVGLKPRHTCNIYIDTPSDLWRNLTAILQLGRAAPLRRGSIYSLIINKPDAPVMMFTQANIISGTMKLSYSTPQDRANAIEITYTDATRDYSRQIIAAYSADYNLSTSKDNKASMRLFGCTDPDEIMRECAFRLNSTQWTTRQLEFEANIDALAAQTGDLIYFQHDAPKWSEGGRVVSATLNTITFDKPLEVDGVSTYSVMIRFTDDTIVEKELVSQAAGSYTTFTVTVDFLVAPVQYDPYMFGPSVDLKRTYRISKISKSSDQTRLISCTEYNVAIYTDTDYVFELPQWDPQIQNAAAVNTAETVTLESDGSYITHVNVTWMPTFTDEGYDWVVWLENVTSGSEPVNVGRTGLLHFIIPSDKIQTDNDYIVYVTRYNQGAVDTGQNTDTFKVLREFAPPSDVVTFTGTYDPIIRTVLFSWSKIDDIDLDHYEIREGGTDWATATPIIDHAVGGAASHYIEDATTATITYRIKAVDTSEKYSVNQTVTTVDVDTTLTNLPAPTGLVLVTGSNILPDGTDEVYIRATWDANSEISDEFSHYDLEIESPTGWLNRDITQNTEYSWTIVANQTYTIRLRASDKAGNNSAWASAAILSGKDATPPEQVTWPGAGSDIVPGFKLMGLSWTKSAAADIAGYVVERSVDVDFTVPIDLGTISANYFVDTQLDVSTPYWYRVKGVDRSGNLSDLWSIVVTATTLQVGESDIAANSITANSLKVGEIFTSNLQSSDYVAGASGYNLSSLVGTAEFNNMTMVLNWGTDVGGTDIPAAGADVTPPLPSDQNLKAYWSCNDTAGNTISDLSGNSHDAVITGTANWATGPSGGSTEVSDTITNSIPISTDFDVPAEGLTLVAWVKLSSVLGLVSTNYEVFSCLNDVIDGWLFRVEDTVDPATAGKLTVMSGDGVGYNSNSSDAGAYPNDQAWHMLTVVFNTTDSKMYIYLGSVLIITGTANSAFVTPIPMTTTAGLGGLSSQKLNGFISEVRIYKQILNQSEIKALFLNPSGSQALTTPWEGVVGDNTPADNADVTGDNISADTVLVAGTTAATVRDNASTALTATQDMSADGILSSQEKATWRVQWPGMLANYDAIMLQAVSYGIDADAKFVDFTSDKDALLNYLTTTLEVWLSPTLASVISPDTQLTDYVNLFYDAMQTCISAVADYSPQANIDSILDTTTGGLIVRNAGTLDYAQLTAGDLNFYYWNGTVHELYKSVNRFEQGVASNGDTVILPGIWLTMPKVVLTPMSIALYSAAYPTNNQSLSLLAINLSETATGSRQYSFDVVAELVLETASQTKSPATSVTIGTSVADNWVYSADQVSDTATTGTVTLYITGSMDFRSDAASTTTVNGILQMYNNGVWVDVFTKNNLTIAASSNIVVAFSGAAVQLDPADLTYALRFALMSPDAYAPSEFTASHYLTGDIDTIVEEQPGQTLSTSGQVMWTSTENG